MNIWKRMRKRRLEILKKQTASIDASELFKKLFEHRNDSPEVKKKLIEAMEDGFKTAGKYMLERAFFEKIMTPKEWKDIKDRYGLTAIDMTAVLQAVFERKDKVAKVDNFIVVTESGSKLDLARDFIENRFGILVRSIEEATETLEQEERERKLKEETK